MPIAGVDVGALIEHRGLVGHAVARGVLEDDDAIARGAQRLRLELPVVEALEQPDPSARIDVDVRRVRDRRRFGDERGGEAGSDLERLDAVGAAVDDGAGARTEGRTRRRRARRRRRTGGRRRSSMGGDLESVWRTDVV
jgi:hypothetical protein